jgi:hypothetical protein
MNTPCNSTHPFGPFTRRDALKTAMAAAAGLGSLGVASHAQQATAKPDARRGSPKRYEMK